MKSLSLAKPHVLIMAGIPSSGKTFFALKFAETFHAPIISQEYIAAHVSGDEKAFEAVVLEQLQQLLKTQKSIIVDGIADTRAVRSEISQKAKAAGYDTLLIWVQTDPSTAKSRASKRTDDSLHRLLTGDEYTQAVKRFSAPAAIEKPIVISGKHTHAAQAKVILKRLSEPRAGVPLRGTIAPERPEPTSPGRRNVIIR